MVMGPDTDPTAGSDVGKQSISKEPMPIILNFVSRVSLIVATVQVLVLSIHFLTDLTIIRNPVVRKNPHLYLAQQLDIIIGLSGRLGRTRMP
ncbi:hypothetical protein PILCRDRAFT_729201 [Piloderma croceum F 1598]|uniref:Uncharacterized protein n=1 Tax=Piloderma croceum (strain F 1598) TaxID=765440 RepID=A0A0C3EL50_PILCF|nr:hypothetical protein PILCRDRAFT_729201 [Piloderma croceum F 1598]